MSGKKLKIGLAMMTVKTTKLKNEFLKISKEAKKKAEQVLKTPITFDDTEKRCKHG